MLTKKQKLILDWEVNQEVELSLEESIILLRLKCFSPEFMYINVVNDPTT